MLNTPLPPRGANALVIGRFSSEHQNPLSADIQIHSCVLRCEELGWNVRGTFKDEAKSGRTVHRRSGYLAMMAAAEAGPVDVIVATSLDRIGRNARELHDARDRLSDVDAVIYTLDRGVMNRLEFAMYAEMAQIESEKIADRTGRGQRAAAARGKVMGDVPYGYRKVTDEGGSRVEIDPLTAPIVLRVNRDYAAGLSPVKIATALTREGIPTPEGLEVWSPNTILGTRRSGNGLLRNPMFVGKIVFGKTKVTLNPKTGKYIKRKASQDDMVFADAPWLRILPDELWEQVQDLLLKRAFKWEKRQTGGSEDAASSEEPALTPPHENRRPEYLLTGLTKCAKCGGAYAMTTSKLGCVNHRVKACDNGVRVVREDAERVVLEGLRGRIAQAHIIDWFVPEYLSELEQASKESVDQDALRTRRLEEVGREIDNLLKQVRAGASGYAAKLLNENLESLGLEQERLNRELRARKPKPSPPLTTEAVTARLHALLDDIGTALRGDERDAARARDIVRSFIEKVVITPIEVEKGQDRRRCGAVRIEVKGSISTLVDQALLDRKILHSPGTEAVQGLPTATFRYYVDLDRRLSDEQEGVYADQATLARLLEEADFPVHRSELRAALNDLGREPTSEEAEVLERRLQFALRSLQRNDWVRTVGQGAEARWVWNGRRISDVEWLNRLRNPETFTPPIGVFRVTPPEAYVVVVERPVA